MITENLPIKKDIEALKALKKEYIQDFEKDSSILNLNEKNNQLDDALQDLTLSIKKNSLKNNIINNNTISLKENNEKDRKIKFENFTKNRHSKANEEKYINFHNSLEGLLKDSDDESNPEVIEFINEENKNDKDNHDNDHKSGIPSGVIEYINEEKRKDENNDSSDTKIRKEMSNEINDHNKENNDSNPNEKNIINNSLNNDKITNTNNDAILSSEKKKEDDKNESNNKNVDRNIETSDIDFPIRNGVVETSNTLDSMNSQNKSTIFKKKANYDKNISNINYIPNTNDYNNGINTNNHSTTTFPKNNKTIVIENQNSSSVTYEHQNDDVDELFNRYEEMKTKISSLTSLGYNDIINKYTLNSNTSNIRSYKRIELNNNTAYMNLEEINLLKDNSNSIPHSIDNSYVSNTSTPVADNSSYETVNYFKTENLELKEKLKEQKEYLKKLKEELNSKIKENNNLNNQLSELKIKIEDITHKHSLETSKIKMSVISEKSKLDSQMSDIIHKCSLYESTIKNKDKIIDDLKIQIEVINDGTTQKLKSLDEENKKNCKLYNAVQVELMETKKNMIQQKQNYEIEIHNLKSEIEKVQDISSQEKQELLLENSRLEKEKTNLKKRLNECENEKELLTNDFEDKVKKLNDLENLKESLKRKNEIIQKRNLELEQQIQLENQQKLYTKKKYYKEYMKLKKMNQKYKNSLEMEQQQHKKDITEKEEKNKALIEKLKKQEQINEKKCSNYFLKIESQNKIIQEYEIRLTELEQSMQKLKNQYEKEIEKRQNKIKEVEKRSKAFLSYMQNQTNGLL